MSVTFASNLNRAPRTHARPACPPRGIGVLPFLLTGLCYIPAFRMAHAEDRVDFKAMLYDEGGERIQVWEPGVLVERDLSPSFTLRVNGVYNMISGASPTGAPPKPVTITRVTNVPYTIQNRPATNVRVERDDDDGPAPVVYPAPYREDDEHEAENEGERRIRSVLPRSSAKAYLFKAGATPAPAAPATPAPAPSAPRTPTVANTSGGGSTSGNRATTTTSQVEDRNGKVPKASVEDERTAFDVEFIKVLENGHTPSLQLAYSQESDYTSMGIAAKDAIAFNKKNTILSLGLAYTGDTVDGLFLPGEEKKDTLDAMAGISQVLNAKTLLTANLTLGMLDGYLSDPYKVAEVNGSLVPDHRPDTKDRQIAYFALTRFIEAANASLETSYRFYNDSFGIQSHTFGLAWYQKLSETFTLRPAVRYYTQPEADFYDVRFTGNPEFYSSDYRVSAFDSIGYGLKGIWQPNERFAADLSIDRYVQEGNDSVTSSDAYTEAFIVIFGVRVWL